MRPMLTLSLLLLLLVLTGCQGGCVRWQQEATMREHRRGIERGQQTDLLITRSTQTSGEASMPMPSVGLGLAEGLMGGGALGLILAALRELGARRERKLRDERERDLIADRDEGWDRALGESPRPAPSDDPPHRKHG